MDALRRSKKALRRALAVVLAVAICVAPVATARAMIDLAAEPGVAAIQYPPCHGAASETQNKSNVDGARIGCVCTPWCAFTALTADDGSSSYAPAHGVEALHRRPAIKPSAVDPPFEPPRA